MCGFSITTSVIKEFDFCIAYSDVDLSRVSIDDSVCVRVARQFDDTCAGRCSAGGRAHQGRPRVAPAMAHHRAAGHQVRDPGEGGGGRVYARDGRARLVLRERAARHLQIVHLHQRAARPAHQKVPSAAASALFGFDLDSSGSGDRCFIYTTAP